MPWEEEWEGFDWDDGNSSKNWLSHGITMAECEQVFTNEPLFVVPDVKHSELEVRCLAFGKSDKGKTITVGFTMRGKRIRPITARHMSRKERKSYAKERA